MSDSDAKDHDLIDDLVRNLKRQRDEIALPIHLAEMDARDEFESAKSKLDDALAKYEPLRDAVDESAGNLWKSLKLVANEVKDSFDRVRKTL